MKETVLNFLRSDINFRITKIRKQHWKKGKKYSCIEVPRADFEILLVLRGRVDFISKGEPLSATDGSVVFLPKESSYIANFSEETENYIVSFDANEKSCWKFPIKLIERAPIHCVECFGELVNESLSEAHTRLRSKGLFYLFINSITNTAEIENDSHLRLVTQTIELLHNSEKSVCEIAKECAVSESSLRHIFKEKTGITPIEYRLCAKIKKAIYLLESTNLTVCEISDNLGFFDAAYFSKVFKKIVGVTPKQYSHNFKI